MTIIDQALSQLADTSLDQVADRAGLTPAQAESVVAALGRSMPEPEDTVGLAAARTELPVEKVRAVFDAIGGEAVLARIVGGLSEGGGVDSVLSGMFSRG